MSRDRNLPGGDLAGGGRVSRELREEREQRRWEGGTAHPADDAASGGQCEAQNIGVAFACEADKVAQVTERGGARARNDCHAPAVKIGEPAEERGSGECCSIRRAHNHGVRGGANDFALYELRVDGIDKSDGKCVNESQACREKQHVGM